MTAFSGWPAVWARHLGRGLVLFGMAVTGAEGRLHLTDDGEIQAGPGEVPADDCFLTPLTRRELQAWRQLTAAISAPPAAD